MEKEIANISNDNTELSRETTEPGSVVKDLTLWQAVRKWRKTVLYCLGLSSGTLLYGYDLVIVGTVTAVPAFQKDFGRYLDDDWILPSIWLALWNIGTPIGLMAGSIFGGYFQDRVGRRGSLALGSMIAVIGVAIMFPCFAFDEVLTRRGVFLAGKLVQGTGIGVLMATTQTYMSEVLPPALRGPILAFLPIFILCGQLLGAIVIFTSLDLPGRQSYTVCFGSQWPFSAVAIAMAIYAPETPAYLIRKNKLDQAFKSQKRLDRADMDTTGTIERLQISIEREQRESKSNYTDCFKPLNIRRTMIVIFANVIPQIFGLALLAKASYFLQIVGMDSDQSVIFLIVGIILGLIGNIGSFWTLNSFGRRPLILISLGTICVLWLGVGIAGCFSGQVTVWYTAISMMLVIVIGGLGAWPASIVVASETSALNLRAKAQGIGWFTGGLASGVMGFVLPYIFNPDQGNLRAKTGFVYAGFCALGSIIVWFTVPEMKGRTHDEIDKLFELALSAREFKGISRDTFEDSYPTQGLATIGRP